MIVYIVRHGESEGNVANVHQGAHVSLSEIGKSQAALVAHRFKRIPVEVVMASDYVRTVQTAEIINEVIQKPIEITPLLEEIHRPSEIVGYGVHDPVVTKTKQEIKKHRDEPEWHYSDEENFFDFKLRARECLRMIEDRSESKILCVTHGLMLCMIMSVIIFGDELTPALFEKMFHQFHNQNTGITICKHDESGWHLITWNDHAHLG